MVKQGTSVIEFGKANRNHLGSIVALVERAYRGEASRAGWTTESELLDGQRTDWEEVQELFERAGSSFLLGWVEGHLMATLHLELDEEEAHIGMFAVEPRYQGRGYGSALLERAEGMATLNGASWTTMSVIAQREDIIQWYARRGYAPTGEVTPFPYDQTRFGVPVVDDLYFVTLRKNLSKFSFRADGHK